MPKEQDSGSRKREVEYKGGSLHDGFDGFSGSGEHLTSFCLSYEIQHNEATVAVLTVSAVMAVSVMTATPLKLNPLFRDPVKLATFHFRDRPEPDEF